MRRRTLLKGAVAAGAVPAGALLGPSGGYAYASYYVATCEQYTNKVLVYPSDVAWGDVRHWSFTPDTSGGWVNLSDVRFRGTTAFGWVALVTASGGNVAIVDVTSEVDAELNDVLWHAAPGGNPHAAERIPDNGSVVVASSHGYLSVYAPSAVSDPSTLALVQTVAFDGAHGVLWDATYRRLWAIGSGRATPFTVTGTYRNTRLSANDGSVNLGTYVASDGATYPVLGHDLQPDYSDPTHQTLLATHTTAVVGIDTATMGTPRVLYRTGGVKSFVRHTSGEAFWVKATGATYHGDSRDWVSPTVQFFDASGAASFTRSLPYGAEFYKARLWSTAFE